MDIGIQVILGRETSTGRFSRKSWTLSDVVITGPTMRIMQVATSIERLIFQHGRSYSRARRHQPRT